MVSTTGEQFAYFQLDEELQPKEKPLPQTLRPTVDLITENCEPALCTVMFMGGAGGSLRAGATKNPVKLTSVGTGATYRCIMWRRTGLCLARRWHHDHA